MPSEDITQILAQWSRGEQAALDCLLPVVYAELRQLAAAYLRRERPGHTLQATALVNEAYLRLVQSAKPEFDSRRHNQVESAPDGPAPGGREGGRPRGPTRISTARQ